MKISTHLFSKLKLLTCTTLLLVLGSCSGGGSGGGSTTAPPPTAGATTVTGTVSGTVIKVLRADTKAVISQFDTAPLPGPPPLRFTLSKVPVGLPIEIFFFSAGEAFPLYVGSPSTNVFTVKTAEPIHLGAVAMGGGKATPQHHPSNLKLGAEDLTPLPQGVAPLPATLTVTPPAPAEGSVIVEFDVHNFVIGGKGQQHLHITVDGGPTRHFFNGQTNLVLDDSGQPTPNDVERQTGTSFRINRLSPGPHTVSARLSTASNNEFVNQEANPPDVTVTINSPTGPLPILTITSPLPGALLPSGPVDVLFTVQNFTIGSQSAAHLHIYLDGGPTNHFYNDTNGNGEVLDDLGQPVANITWQGNNSFQITGLSGGSHAIRLALALSSHKDLTNADATPPELNITIKAPAAPPTLTITKPAPEASLPPGPVLVTFNIQNSPVPLSTTQPRMHFYVDNDPVVYKFYDGPEITETGITSGVRYHDVHTHAVHWKSGSSIELNALASGAHQVQFVLVDQTGTELASTANTLSFTILPGTGGDFSLQEVVSGLIFPASMATAPDGRIFVTELYKGNIRVVTPTTTLPWQLQTTPFYTFPTAEFVTGTENGLLGIEVDPNFQANNFVYLFYTAPGPKNRVVRFTATTDSNGNTVAAPGLPTVIVDDLPAPATGFGHDGGVIHFGPDGLLYIFVGENEVAADAQDLSSLRGKFLRVNPTDGSAPLDNPFISTPNAKAKIYSLGHRNSFGFTFHPHTNDLWETENGLDDNDQINRIIAGKNYGWPLCTGICNNPLWIDPIITFTPVIAPTGIVAIREDSVYPAQYHNNLLFADWKFGQLHRIVLGGAELRDLSSPPTIVCDCGQGGLTSVMHGLNLPGQDGYIYVTTGYGGKIFRVLPPP